MSGKIRRPAIERARDGRDFLISKGYTDWANELGQFDKTYGLDINRNCCCAVAATTGRPYTVMEAEWGLSQLEAMALGFCSAYIYDNHDDIALKEAWRQLTKEAEESNEAPA